MSKTYRREDRKKLQKKFNSPKKSRESYFDNHYSESSYNENSDYSAEDRSTFDYKKYRNYKK
jgi:hypothetical protein